jgi:Mn2+/Fe2+ NRAMP family transporter
LLAATAIGASHLVMAPQAGALFGVTLLWLVPLSHLIKYPAFEFGPRYAAATGESLLSGYARVPGPRRWALWVFLVSTVLQGAGVLAGVVAIAAAVLASYSSLAFTACGAIVVVAVLALLIAGGFGWLDNLNKTMMAILALATMVAAFAQLPPEGTLTGLVVPRIPIGSIALVAAVLGWMPTGIDVSVWHSLWTLEKEQQLEKNGKLEAESSAPQRLRLALSDMRIGYGLSIVVALVFILLGATYLTDQANQMRGAQFPEALAGVYGSALGRWMYHLFFVAAFFAMFSTSYTVIDGFSRSFSEVLTLISVRSEQHKRRLYLGFAFVSGAIATILVCTVGNPVTLVMVVAVISLCFAPVLYGLNTWCVVTQIRDEALRPSKILVGLAIVGTCIMAGAALFYAVVKLG